MVGNISDAKARLSDTTEFGPVSTSGRETTHPSMNVITVGGVGTPVGDPSSGQTEKIEKQGSANPLDEPNKSKKDEAEGTGQKYVKSTGTVSEDGDFDAANPGAGVWTS